MDRQIQFIRNRLSVLITHLIEERFEILENKNDLKFAFLNDGKGFALLMIVTVREKIHRFADESMRKLKKLDTNIDLTRLEGLVKVHITQMKKINTRHIDVQIEFYNDMIKQIKYTQRFLNLLISKSK